MKLPALLALTVALVGCAASPERIVNASNYDICRWTLGGVNARNAEIVRAERGLDCGPIYPLILAREQQQNQAVQNYLNATRPRPTTNCTSYRNGNTVQTTCQ